MMQAVRERVTIQPSGRIELDLPGLPTGAEVEVIVIAEEPGSPATFADQAGEPRARADEEPPDYRKLLEVPDVEQARRTA